MNRTNLKLSQKERTLFSICVVFLFGFLLVTLLRTSFQSVDVTVNLWIPSIQSSALTFIAKGVALVFDTTSLVLFSLVISGILFLKNYKAQGLLLLGAMGGDALIVSVIKTVVNVARPTNGIMLDTGLSYPSGHSAGVVVFVGMLAYFAWRHWRSTLLKVLIGVWMPTLVGIVGFDRVYLNVHWLSDIFGGWLFGVFWLSFVILVFIWLEEAGKFRLNKFKVIANWLYVAAIAVSFVVVVSGFVR